MIFLRFICVLSKLFIEFLAENMSISRYDPEFYMNLNLIYYHWTFVTLLTDKIRVRLMRKSLKTHSMFFENYKGLLKRTLSYKGFYKGIRNYNIKGEF